MHEPAGICAGPGHLTGASTLGREPVGRPMQPAGGVRRRQCVQELGVMVDEERRQVFDEFARARMPELLRFGHALTGSPHAAADLVQDALERTMLAWGRVENQGDPEGYVRRIMVNRNISIWRRHRRETLVLDVPEDAGRRGAGPSAV